MKALAGARPMTGRRLFRFDFVRSLYREETSSAMAAERTAERERLTAARRLPRSPRPPRGSGRTRLRNPSRPRGRCRGARPSTPHRPRRARRRSSSAGLSGEWASWHTSYDSIETVSSKYNTCAAQSQGICRRNLPAALHPARVYVGGGQSGKACADVPR